MLGPGLPYAIAVGYMKYAAGDETCPYFVVLGIGGDPVAWCDCLPDTSVANVWSKARMVDRSLNPADPAELCATCALQTGCRGFESGSRCGNYQKAHKAYQDHCSRAATEKSQRPMRGGVDVETSCGECGHDQIVEVDPYLEQDSAICDKCGLLFNFSITILAEGDEPAMKAENGSESASAGAGEPE
jgi:hypothetical protein